MVALITALTLPAPGRSTRRDGLRRVTARYQVANRYLCDGLHKRARRATFTANRRDRFGG
jgi:hypothetical protein